MLNTSKKRTGVDMLHGVLWNKILRYALPLAATGICQQFFNATDIAVVGQFVGKEAMAAVGSNAPVIGLIVSFFIGISLGATVVLAQATGRGDTLARSRAVHTAIMLAVTGGILIAGFGEVLAVPVLLVTGVPAEVLKMAELYLRIYLAGMPVILLFNFLAAIFRSQGDAQTPLRALILSGVINAVLNLFFVLALGWTVDGVATATVIANGVSSLCLLYKLAHMPGALRFHWRLLGFDKKILRNILKVGVPSGVQNSLFSVANIVIQSAINSLGATVIAGAAAAYNLEIFAYYVMNAFNQTATAFAGQNYGAGNSERCRRTFVLCLAEGYVLTAVACIAIIAFSSQLIALFNPDLGIFEIGRIKLEYVFFAYIFSVLQEVGSGYLRAFGLSMLPAVISVFGICVSRLVWVTTVFQATPTFPVLMEAYPMSLGITGIAIGAAVLWARPSKSLMRHHAAV